MKFGRIVDQIRVDCRCRISDMTSYFQDGGHEIRPPLAAALAAVSAGCPLAHRARVTSLARCVRYSSVPDL